MSASCRKIAHKILLKVIENKVPLTPTLIAEQCQNISSKEKSFIQNICFGVLRHFNLLDKLLNIPLNKPLKSKDFAVGLLIIQGIYELKFSRSPDYAVCHSYTDLAVKIKKPWAKALITSILRFWQDRSFEDFQLSNNVKASHPQWIIDKISQDYPNDIQDILLANNQHPPLSIRVNQQKISRPKYIEMLKAQGLSAQPIEHTDYGIEINPKLNIEKLPGYKENLFCVQDGGAQLAAMILDLQPEQTVLDSCAAPGGKTIHIYHQQPHLKKLVAIESCPKRFKLLKASLDKFSVPATCLQKDATEPNTWWDNQQFDRILLDAPCSGSGVIRRHPDIKILRTATDIVNLQAKQQALLTNLWPLLKPNGILLYITCSIFSVENDKFVSSFVKENKDVEVVNIDASWGIPQQSGRQILPGQYNMDGFYFAKLKKVP